MASAETVILNLLGIVSYAAGAHIAVEYILPRVRMIAAEVLRYPKTADSLIYLLSVIVYLAAAQGIIERVVATQIPGSSYINVAAPALDVLKGLIPWVKTLLIGVGAVLLVERIRLKA